MKQLTITLLTLTMGFVAFADYEEGRDPRKAVAEPAKATVEAASDTSDIAQPPQAVIDAVTAETVTAGEALQAEKRKQQLAKEVKIDKPTLGLLSRIIGAMTAQDEINNENSYLKSDKYPEWVGNKNHSQKVRWNFAKALSKLGLNNGSDTNNLSEGARKSILKAYSNPTTFLNACEANIPMMIQIIKSEPTPEKKINVHTNLKNIIEEEMSHVEHVLTGNPVYDSYYDMSKAFPEKFNSHDLSNNNDFLGYAFYKRRFDEGGKPLLDAYNMCGKKALAALQVNEPPAITPVAGQWGPYHNTDYGIEYGRDGGASGE